MEHIWFLSYNFCFIIFIFFLQPFKKCTNHYCGLYKSRLWAVFCSPLLSTNYLRFSTSFFILSLSSSWDLHFDKSLGWLVFFIKYARTHFSWESSLVQCSYFSLVYACFSVLLCASVAHQGQAVGVMCFKARLYVGFIICRKILNNNKVE